MCHWTCTFVYMCLYASISCNFLTFWSSQSHKDISLRSKSKITFIVIFLNPWTLLSLIPVSCMYIIYAQVIYIWLKNERIHGRFTLLLHQSIWKLSQKRSLIFCGCHGYTSCSCFDDDGVVKRDILEIILWNHVGISLISLLIAIANHLLRFLLWEFSGRIIIIQWTHDTGQGWLENKDRFVRF